VWFVGGGSGNATIIAVSDMGHVQVSWDDERHNPDNTWWPPEDFDHLTKEPSKDANPLR